MILKITIMTTDFFKKLVFLLFVLLCIQGYTQEVKLQKTKPFTFSTQQQAIGKATLTTKYVVVKNQKQFLYCTNKGTYFYIQNKDSNEYVRKYVKVE